jgi:hypothetical protein
VRKRPPMLMCAYRPRARVFESPVTWKRAAQKEDNVPVETFPLLSSFRLRVTHSLGVAVVYRTVCPALQIALGYGLPRVHLLLHPREQRPPAAETLLKA